MTLGGIFDRLFKLIGKTWKRNLAITSTILILPSILLILGLNAFFSNLIEIIPKEAGVTPPTEILFSVFMSMSWFFAGLLIFLFGTAAATLGVTIIGCAEMNGEQIAIGETFHRTFGIRLVRLFGQLILEGLVLTALVLIPYALIIVAITVKSLLLGLAAGLLLVVSFLFVIYFAISWAFTVPAIGWEDAHIIQAFTRSMELVKGNWWRVFGILILMSILVSFAISLLVTPVYLVVMWDFFISYFRMIGSLGSDHSNIDPSTTFGMLKSLGIGIGFMNALTTILQILVKPLYIIVLYFDLRARRELHSQPPTTLPL
jgi:hypothetical protein